MAIRGTPSIRSAGAAACCSPLTGDVLDLDAARSQARAFEALGDPTRVRLLSPIAAADGGEACICGCPQGAWHIRVPDGADRSGGP